MKTISVRQLASIKRTAQNVYPMVAKKNKIAAKIQELGQEFNEINEQIRGWEGAVISMTGHTSEDIVTRTVTPILDENGNQKLDANGRPMNITKYEPSALLVFDEEKKVYTVIEPEATAPATSANEEPANEAPAETETPAFEDNNNDPWGE